jgi:ATP-dependent RNA helicase DDX27
MLIYAQPKRDKLSGLTRRAKRRKLALMDDAEANNNGAVSAAIRSAKKTTRPVKIGDKQPKPFDAKSKKRKGPRVSATSFDRDLGQKRVQEGARARKTDSVNLSKKGGKKRG